jgi:hypothetical protein
MLPSASSYCLQTSASSCNLLLLPSGPSSFLHPPDTSFSLLLFSPASLLPAPWHFLQPPAPFSSFTSSRILLLSPASWYFLQPPAIFSSFTSSSLLLLLPASCYFFQLHFFHPLVASSSLFTVPSTYFSFLLPIHKFRPQHPVLKHAQPTSPSYTQMSPSAPCSPTSSTYAMPLI